VRRLHKLDARIPSWDPRGLVERSCPFCGDDGEARFVRPDGLTVKCCDTCGASFVSPAPDENQLRAFYSTYFARHRGRRRPNARAVLNARPWDDFRVVEIASHTGLSGRRVLDVGCGWGTLLRRFQKLGASVVGTDLDPEAVRFAQERIGLPSVKVGTLEELAPQESFDVICMCDFIEHPLDPLQELERAVSLLVPEGIIAIWTPNASSARDDEDPIAFRVDQEHMQYLSTQTCQWLARKLDLSILHIESVGFAGLNGIGTSQRRNGRRGIASSFKRLAPGLPGWHALRTIRERFLPRRTPNPRSGTYHLFCILRKGA